MIADRPVVGDVDQEGPVGSNQQGCCVVGGPLGRAQSNGDLVGQRETLGPKRPLDLLVLGVVAEHSDSGATCGGHQIGGLLDRSAQGMCSCRQRSACHIDRGAGGTEFKGNALADAAAAAVTRAMRPWSGGFVIWCSFVRFGRGGQLDGRLRKRGSGVLGDEGAQCGGYLLGLLLGQEVPGVLDENGAQVESNLAEDRVLVGAQGHGPADTQHGIAAGLVMWLSNSQSK